MRGVDVCRFTRRRRPRRTRRPTTSDHRAQGGPVTAVDKLQDLVSLERGEIDRRIFSGPEIFALELKTIFARSWLFLCH